MVIASRVQNCLRLMALLAWFAPMAAQAQQTIVINNGAKLQIAADQKLMFAAMQKAMQRDFRSAEALYTQAIALNSHNIDAYLQRGMMRRELGDKPGMASDGRAAVVLANNALQSQPRNATLYYQRGMGFRLMKNFDQAQKDVQTAIQQGGDNRWQTDLQAIELEKKSAE